MAKIRIVDADFYFAPPINGLDALTSEFRGTQIAKVPLIRIFGATEDGYKTCLHVHGVFPYIYIPHDGKENHESLRYTLANAIDKTLNVALGQAVSKAQHVYKINLVSGIPYYGYHAREHQFFKIFFYNPHLMKKVCTFLENGTILGRVYQPHEAHIPYIQQFMIDYNLHGMSFIQLSELHHRHKNGVAPIFTKSDNYILPANIARISRCAWECDARAESILNVQEVTPNAMTNPGIATIWADERQRRIDLSQSSQLSHCLSQNRTGLQPTQSHIVYFHKLQERLLSSDSSNEERQNVDANVSVYPAETPESGELLSGGSESFDVSCIENSHEQVDDAACEKLYLVLRDLAEASDVAQRTSIPEDSILSQLPLDNINVDENTDLNEEEEHELDLSMPLERTPVKQQPVRNCDFDDDLDNLSDSCFVNIPQLDGTYDLRSGSVKDPTTTVKCVKKSIVVKNTDDDSNVVTESIRNEKVRKRTTKTISDSMQTKKKVKKVVQDSTVTTSNQDLEAVSTEEIKCKETTAKCKRHSKNAEIASLKTSKQKNSKNLKIADYQYPRFSDDSSGYASEMSDINVRKSLRTKLKNTSGISCASAINAVTSEKVSSLDRNNSKKINKPVARNVAEKLKALEISGPINGIVQTRRGRPKKADSLINYVIDKRDRTRPKILRITSPLVNVTKTLILPSNEVETRAPTRNNKSIRMKILKCKSVRASKGPKDTSYFTSIKTSVKSNYDLRNRREGVTNSDEITVNVINLKSNKCKTKVRTDTSVYLRNIGPSTSQSISSQKCRKSKPINKKTSEICKWKTARKYREVSIKNCLNASAICNHDKRRYVEDSDKHYYERNFNNNLDMPILEWDTSYCSTDISPNVSCNKKIARKAVLKENATLNSLKTVPKLQMKSIGKSLGASKNELKKNKPARKSVLKENRPSKAVSNLQIKTIGKSLIVLKNKNKCNKKPPLVTTEKKKLSFKTLRRRKQLKSKILQQEVQKDMVNYIALQTGRKPKFNLVYGRRIPVLPLNVSKVNCSQFPNTKWSNELTQVALTPEKCGSNIVVLENKTLEDHEKYDLSTLFSHVSASYKTIDSSLNNNYLLNHIDFGNFLCPLDVLDCSETMLNNNNYSNYLNNSKDVLDIDWLLEDICNLPNVANRIEEEKNNNSKTNIDNSIHLEDYNNNIASNECFETETNHFADDVSEKNDATEIQYSLDKNNYRSQLTMEKFRYLKRKQDRHFANIKKYFSNFVENSNISGRLVIREIEREAREDRETANSLSDDDDDDDDDVGRNIFSTKTVAFKKRVIIREYISTEPISAKLHKDVIHRLNSDDQLEWVDLKRSRTFDHLLNLDGPNDSTDDEESSKVPRKKTKTICRKPSYKSLPLVCGKLSQVTHTGARDIPFPPESTKCDDEAMKNEKWMESTATRHPPQRIYSSVDLNLTSSCDKTVPSTAKRKLTFQEINISALDKSTIEESISCRYSNKISPPNVNCISQANVTLNTHSDYRPVLGGVIDEDGNSSDDLFSDEEAENVSKHLTKAERYDIEANYVPKAGTSAMKSSGDISQCTSSDLDTVVSREENDTSQEITTKISFLKNSGSATCDIILSQIKSSPQELELDTTITQSYSNEDCASLSLGDITTFRNQDLDNTLTEQSLTKNLAIYETSPKVNYKKTEDGFYEIVPKYNPPTKEYLQSTMIEFNIPIVRTQLPFYGVSNDVSGPVEVGMRSLYIRGRTVAYLPDFHEGTDAFAKATFNFSKLLDPTRKLTAGEITNLKMSFFGNETCLIETVCKPPSKADVKLWLKEKGLKKLHDTPSDEISVATSQSSLNSNHGISRNTNFTDVTNNNETSNKISLENDLNETINSSEINQSSDSSAPHKKQKDNHKSIKLHINVLQNISADPRSLENSCQITGPTLNNTHGFKMSFENLQNVRAVHEHQYLTVIVIELHVQTRGDFKPNPELDAICAIFFAIYNDVPDAAATHRHLNGLFAVNCPATTSSSQSSGLHLNGAGVSCCNITYFDDEVSLMNGFVAFIHECDPDILVGYEIQMSSWGYLIERGATLGINLYPSLSRVEDPTPGNREKHEDAFGDLYITGRIVLDLWRILKHEIALQSYTFENIVYHILHQRVALHSFRNLTSWWNHRFPNQRHKTVEYYLYRVKTTLQLMDQLDLVGRTSEMARLFGILFYEVLSRGSQFRVESMMLRLAKPLKYIPVSPGVQQRAKMRAPEFLPLILEPESKLYTDPVIVLDFQSLYPSIIIAYNYCFSTCIGRVEHLGSNAPFEFGATQLKISRRKVKKLLHADQLYFSPCGVAFVKNAVRPGILPRMLQEILDTRLMVKKSMKMHKNNKTLQRVLHSRQLGLKLIANVTYGYTAANFSGRMPSVEVGDSVVAKGRETLLRAIKLVESHPSWNCRVVYGDTDSMFVLVQGRCRAEAFRIGAEIAEAVTIANPSPIRLKLEKVYQPCILQTKKRYVGYMYETSDQKEPVYEAKGIETVRRDGCPAVAKMLEKCIRILFESRDVSQIKKYVLRQFSKIVSARASIQDLTFAKEYRGASGYRPGACVPALELTRKWTATDKRNEPRSGERVPYVIVNGPPGLPLIRMVRSPHELLSDGSLIPNALYYITRVIIPPINRCFKLIGADLHQWFNEMPRKHYKYLPTSSPNKGKKSTISQYFITINCATCNEQTKDGVCPSCLTQPQRTSFILYEKIRTLEQSYQNTLKICESCTGRKMDIQCISLDCPVLYRHIRNERDLQQTNFIRELIHNLPRLEDC